MKTIDFNYQNPNSFIVRVTKSGSGVLNSKQLANKISPKPASYRVSKTPLKNDIRNLFCIITADPLRQLKEK